jgi:hypothetical protein
MCKIDEIVSKAIPRETCGIKEANAKWRRERLKKEILLLINPNEKVEPKPFNPITNYKREQPY